MYGGTKTLPAALNNHMQPTHASYSSFNDGELDGNQMRQQFALDGDDGYNDSNSGRSTSARRPKTHACNFEGCGKSFDSRWALVRHVRTHTGEKPFPCEFPGCSKSFAEKSAMTRHLQTHSSAKPYKCHYEGCGKSFKGKEYLEFHLKIHAEGNPYACPHPSCAKTFCSPKSLKKHIRLWHNPGGKSTSVEQQLRERIIKMTNRNKEKQAKADASIKALTDQVKALRKEVGVLKRRLGEPYDSEAEDADPLAPETVQAEIATTSALSSLYQSAAQAQALAMLPGYSGLMGTSRGQEDDDDDDDDDEDDDEEDDEDEDDDDEEDDDEAEEQEEIEAPPARKRRKAAV